MRPPHFDVVVVGAGFAGLVAANRAAQLGSRVCVVEKGADADYACNSRIATGVLSVAHGNPRRDADELFAAIMEDTEGHADPELARRLAATVGRAMLWLNREGVKIVKVAMGGRARWILAPPVPVRPGQHWRGRGPDQSLKRLARNLRERGGEIRYGTRATGLLMRDGTCHGIRVETPTGYEEIAAAATLLADGGFQADPDLCARFISPDPAGLVQRNAGSGCGDALRMSEDAGARLVGTDAFYGHVMAADAARLRDLWPYPTIDTLASSAIVVDRSGRRFLDEGLGGIPMANAIARLADPLGATAVFDDLQWQGAGMAELIPPNPYLERLGGTLIAADTVAGLASALNLPAESLAETIDAYNAAIRDGAPERLTPPRSPGRAFGQPRGSTRRLPITPLVQPPFRAIRLAAGISYTLGGIAIDDRARVLSRAGDPISGLFAAGSATGGLEGGPLPGYLGGLFKAFCFGLVAGESMATGAGAEPSDPA